MAADFLLIIMGSLLFFLIYGSRKKSRNLRKNGALSQGTIINTVTSSQKNDSRTFPVVTFEVNAGRIITAKSPESYFSPKFKIGKKVVVLYNKENPEDFVLQIPKEKIMEITVLAGSMVLALGGIVLLLNHLNIIHLFKN